MVRSVVCNNACSKDVLSRWIELCMPSSKIAQLARKPGAYTREIVEAVCFNEASSGNTTSKSSCCILLRWVKRYGS